MQVQLTMNDKSPETYQVTDETYQAMVTDFGSELLRTYSILPSGKVMVDWNKVVKIQETEYIETGILPD